jgi:hypothetical protein
VTAGGDGITNLADPTTDQGAATKAYVDASGGSQTFLDGGVPTSTYLASQTIDGGGA